MNEPLHTGEIRDGGVIPDLSREAALALGAFLSEQAGEAGQYNATDILLASDSPDRKTPKQTILGGGHEAAYLLAAEHLLKFAFNTDSPPSHMFVSAEFKEGRVGDEHSDGPWGQGVQLQVGLSDTVRLGVWRAYDDHSAGIPARRVNIDGKPVDMSTLKPEVIDLAAPKCAVYNNTDITRMRVHAGLEEEGLPYDVRRFLLMSATPELEHYELKWPLSSIAVGQQRQVAAGEDEYTWSQVHLDPTPLTELE